ncbi:DUF2199 domain-containing protein (plasmid) [Streptomyces sp. NBC_00841]|uniref:DUF2199 domain-containing protein n=1 Tax=Streptomyces sp. NBC_00841 TaxID=2975847 RepID=UPI002DDB4C7E|nr:DUF2199 domain-containing protein [Streptomyces sp. NBC_00841]WSA06063.1 DUF2199 domain-containing protein [Streptomyces sp. NBC_00841]
MSNDLGFTCSCCGNHHAELLMSYSTKAPDVWDPSFESDPDSMLSSDQCVIKGQHFFIRGLIEIPVIGSQDVFSWGVWVSLSRDNFTRALEVWNTEGREAEKPYFGWLSTELALYSEGTTNLKTNAHTRPVGKRPFIELEPTDHPLAVEQRTGITQDRVREIAMAVLHPA